MARFKQLRDISLPDPVAEDVRRSQHEAIKQLQKELRDALSRIDTLEAADDPVTDHGELDGLGDDDHSQYLLATGARTGASSQAQAFTNGVDLGSNTKLRDSGGLEVLVGGNRRMLVGSTSVTDLPTIKPRNTAQALGSAADPWARLYTSGREVRGLSAKTGDFTVATEDDLIVWSDSTQGTAQLPNGTENGRRLRIINAGSAKLTVQRGGTTDEIFGSGGNVTSFDLAAGESVAMVYRSSNNLWYRYAEGAF